MLNQCAQIYEIIKIFGVIHMSHIIKDWWYGKTLTSLLPIAYCKLVKSNLQALFLAPN